MEPEDYTPPTLRATLLTWALVILVLALVVGSIAALGWVSNNAQLPGS